VALHEVHVLIVGLHRVVDICHLLRKRIPALELLGSEGRERGVLLAVVSGHISRGIR
jgi:hypothetical protein